MDLSNITPVISDQWITCPKPNPASHIRLFCFPYAGAGSSLFHVWSKSLLPVIELFLVNIPGRDARIRETPHRQLQGLINPLTEGLIPHLNKPFAFFGHSMGSLISFEVAAALRRAGHSLPLHLFVSGRQPPHLPASHPNFHALPEHDFLRAVQETYGELPEIILQDSELTGLFSSLMRADLTMLETYQYEDEAPLACPITVYGGVQDTSVTEQGLAAWKQQTTAGFRMKMFPGEHFFIHTARSAVLEDINTELARYEPSRKA